MSTLSGLGLGGAAMENDTAGRTEHVFLQRPLQRLLAFRQRSIDDVVNSPIVKREIYSYWKVHRLIGRRSEIVELEKQWNTVGL